MSLVELSGPLPPVCVKTGGKADKLRPVRFKYRPASSYALLVLLAVGILASRHREVSLQLPVSRATVRDHWRRVLTTVAGLIGGTVVFAIIGFAFHTQLAIWPALICCFGGLAILLGQQNFISGRLTRNGTVVLKDVSPVWVAAMRGSVANRHLAAAAAHQQAAAALGYTPPQATAPSSEQFTHVSPAPPTQTTASEPRGFCGEPLSQPDSSAWSAVQPQPPVD